jgi:hypothetical protein
VQSRGRAEQRTCRALSCRALTCRALTCRALSCRALACVHSVALCICQQAVHHLSSSFGLLQIKTHASLSQDYTLPATSETMCLICLALMFDKVVDGHIHQPMHSLNHSRTHSLARSLTHSLTRPLTHSLTRSLTHPLTQRNSPVIISSDGSNNIPSYFERR